MTQKEHDGGKVSKKFAKNKSLADFFINVRRKFIKKNRIHSTGSNPF